MINLSPTLTDDRTWRCIAIIAGIMPNPVFEPAFTHPYDAELVTDTQAYRDWLLAQLSNPQSTTYRDAARLADYHKRGYTVVLRIHQNAQHGEILQAALTSLAEALPEPKPRPTGRTHAGLPTVTDEIEEAKTELDYRRFVWITGNDGSEKLGYIWDTEGILTALVPQFGLINVGRLPAEREIKGETRSTPRSYWAQRHYKPLSSRLRVAEPRDYETIAHHEDIFVALLLRQRAAEEFVNERTETPDRYDFVNMGHWMPADEEEIEEEPAELEQLHADESAHFLSFHSAVRTNLLSYLPKNYTASLVKPVIKRRPDGNVAILSATLQLRGVTHMYTPAEELIAIINLHGYKDDKNAITYIGRQIPDWSASPLGNPYKLDKNTPRGTTLQKYKAWLWAQMQTDTPARGELYRLAALVKAGNRITLACWCKPEPCHGDIVKAALLYILKQNLV